MSSDSDSDIEFLAGYRSNPSSAIANQRRPPAEPRVPTPRASAQAPARTPATVPARNTALNTTQDNDVAKIKAEYWEKLGENEILRSQLNKTEAEHQRYLNDLVTKQLYDKEEHRKELEELKRALAKERIQHEFLLIELRSKNSIPHAQTPSSRPNDESSTTLVSHSDSANDSTSSGGSRRRSAITSFNDGFTLKRPKLAPTSSSPASQGPHQIASRTQLAGQPRLSDESSFLSPSAPASSTSSLTTHEADSTRLMAFLVGHHAPGFIDNTLQVLFGYKTSAHNSVGQDLSKSLSLSEFVAKVVGHVEKFSVSLDNDAVALLLSLLYDSLFLELPLSIQHLNVPSRLCDLLIDWVKNLAPLPSFEDLEELGRIRLRHVRLFTCVLYTIDVLLALRWDYEIPYELCRRVLSLTHAPQVYGRCLDLMEAHPQPEFATLLTFEFPPIPFEPTTELLFSGLAACSKLTAVELAQQSEHKTKLPMVAPRIRNLHELREHAENQVLPIFHYIQSASIRLADALIRIGAPSASIDQHVLSLLQSSVDAYTVHRANERTEHCVFYFWCRESSALKQNLAAAGTAELCICLTKLVYQQTDYGSDFLDQCRQLLGFLGNSDENDRLDSTFEPMDRLEPAFEDDEEDFMVDI